MELYLVEMLTNRGRETMWAWIRAKYDDDAREIASSCIPNAFEILGATRETGIHEIAAPGAALYGINLTATDIQQVTEKQGKNSVWILH